jgi:hypothetical protein
MHVSYLLSGKLGVSSHRRIGMTFVLDVNKDIKNLIEAAAKVASLPGGSNHCHTSPAAEKYSELDHARFVNLRFAAASSPQGPASISHLCMPLRRQRGLVIELQSTHQLTGWADSSETLPDHGPSAATARLGSASRCIRQALALLPLPCLVFHCIMVSQKNA